jgi:hypothetical protein
MRLEQLVGSSSFGSAMKQPFLLRRLDILTLAIFLAWCFSPIGSYALQRVLVKRQPEHKGDGELWYVNTNIDNPMFSATGSAGYNDTTRFGILEKMTTMYQGTFLPVSERDLAASYYQDTYDNPLICLPFEVVPYYYFNPNSDPSTCGSPGQYGVPFLVPKTNITVGSASTLQDWNNFQTYSDLISFNLTSTFYNLTCDDWSTRNWDADLNDLLNLDLNGVYGFGMTVTNASSPKYNSSTLNYLAFGSFNRDITRNVFATVNTTDFIPTPNTTWQYSFIECTFAPIRASEYVICHRDLSSGFNIVCNVSDTVLTYATPAETSKKIFEDFTVEWLASTYMNTRASFATDNSQL